MDSLQDALREEYLYNCNIRMENALSQLIIAYEDMSSVIGREHTALHLSELFIKKLRENGDSCTENDGDSDDELPF